MSAIKYDFYVIAPVAVTDAVLHSSTVPEPGPADPAAWASAGTYAVGNTRYRATTHRIYECIQASTGRTQLPEVDTAYWSEVEATQRWKMFDPLRTYPTTHTSPLVVEVDPGARCNAWFVKGVDAQKLTVKMFDGAVEVYSKEVPMTRRNTRSWSDYFFGGFEPVRIAMDDTMPLISTARVQMTFESSTGTVSVAKAVVGRSITLGTTETGAEIDAENYSVIERSDIDGTVTNMVQRRNVPRTSQTIAFNPTDADTLLSMRDRLNATPAVWSAMGSRQNHGFYASLAVYGIYTRFRISADHHDVGRLSLDLEEL